MLIAIALWTKNGYSRHNYSHKLCAWFPDGYSYTVRCVYFEPSHQFFNFRELLFIFSIWNICIYVCVEFFSRFCFILFFKFYIFHIEFGNTNLVLLEPQLTTEWNFTPAVFSLYYISYSKINEIGSTKYTHADIRIRTMESETETSRTASIVALCIPGGPR